MNAKFSAAVAAFALGFPLVAVADETMPSLVIGEQAALHPYEYGGAPAVEYQSVSAIADQVVIDDPSCGVGCSADVFLRRRLLRKSDSLRSDQAVGSLLRQLHQSDDQPGLL